MNVDLTYLNLYSNSTSTISITAVPPHFKEKKITHHYIPTGLSCFIFSFL